jgi:hypothetical protein
MVIGIVIISALIAEAVWFVHSKRRNRREKKEQMETTSSTPKEKLTITLTGRAPVKITKEDWPVIASSGDTWHDGQIECQANRTKAWKLIVRQHADGRTLVYGVFASTSQFQGEGSVNVCGGELLTVEGTTADKVGDTEPIIAAIFRVGVDMHKRSGAVEFARLAYECIADLPAVEL